MDLNAFLILNGGNIQIQKRSGKLTISKHKKKKERKREFHSLDEVGVDGFKIAPRGILIKRVLKKNTCCDTVEERPRREKMGGGGGKTN